MNLRATLDLCPSFFRAEFAEPVRTGHILKPYRHKYELPTEVPLPPGGWTDEGKFLEYIDGAWQRKPGLGRGDVSAAALSAVTLLQPLLEGRGGRAIFGVHVIAVPDLLRPNVSVTFPRYTLYQDYLIAPMLLAVEIIAGKSQLIPM